MTRLRTRSVEPMVFAALLLLGAPVAWAQNAVTLESVHLAPNLQTVGVTATFNGDDNGDAWATLTYEAVGSGTVYPGHPLVRLSGGRFVGSVFYLDPGTEYDVTVVVSDPDNGGDELLTDTTTCGPTTWKARGGSPSGSTCATRTWPSSRRALGWSCTGSP